MNKTPHELMVAIDVGNSRIKLGLFEKNGADQSAGLLPEYLKSIAVDVHGAIPWAELADWSQDLEGEVVTAIMGGVNPPGQDKVLGGWSKTGLPQPVVVDDPAMLPIELRVESPETVGIDRLLNAVAANAIRPADAPLIIISSGTATTVDVVSSSGAFEGGAILAGFQLSARALHEFTAFLPRITNEEITGKPPAPLGKNTRDALRSGLYWGQLGAVRELTRTLGESLSQEPTIIVTGGAGPLIISQMTGALHHPNLPMQGLALVGNML